MRTGTTASSLLPLLLYVFIANIARTYSQQPQQPSASSPSAPTISASSRASQNTIIKNFSDELAKQLQDSNSKQFRMKILHTNSETGEQFVEIDKVNFTNLHEPKIELRYLSKFPYVTLEEKAPINSVAAVVVASDEDQGPNGQVSVSIERGNELNHFILTTTPSQSYIVRVNAPLNRQQVSEYNLTIVARDQGSPPKSSSTNLIIKLDSIPKTPQAHNQIVDYVLYPDLMYVGLTLTLIFFGFVVLFICVCALLQPSKAPRTKIHHPGLNNT